MSTDSTTIDIQHVGQRNILDIKISGKLTKEDYEILTPAVEAFVKTHGKIRILLALHDFHGWTAGALWEDIKFDAKHFRDIERLAIVGESAFEKGMSVFCKPFTSAKIRYFNSPDIAEARTWIEEVS